MTKCQETSSWLLYPKADDESQNTVMTSNLLASQEKPLCTSTRLGATPFSGYGIIVLIDHLSGGQIRYEPRLPRSHGEISVLIGYIMANSEGSVGTKPPDNLPLSLKTTSPRIGDENQLLILY